MTLTSIVVASFNLSRVVMTDTIHLIIPNLHRSVPNCLWLTRGEPWLVLVFTAQPKLFEKLISDWRSVELVPVYLIIFVVLLVTPEQIAQQTERNDQILRQFWAQLISTLDNAPDQSMLQDLIVTNLKVIDDEVPDSWVNTCLLYTSPSPRD